MGDTVMANHTHRPHHPHQHDCNPRTTHDSASFSHDYNFIIPDSPTPIDEVITSLMDSSTKSREIIVNAELLLQTSKAVSVYAESVLSTITHQFQSSANAAEGKTREEMKEIAGKLLESTITEIRLLFTLGFLTGTAVGFAVGLQFEPDEGDGEEDEEGPDYDGPMV
jgi:hypothetical protein